jgi:hypothetical protein
MSESDWRKKVDPQSRRRLREEAVNRPIEVLIRLDAPPTDAHRRELMGLGCEPVSTAGNVISARIADPASVRTLAELSFVRRIDVSRTLYPESADPSAPRRDDPDDGKATPNEVPDEEG